MKIFKKIEFGEKGDLVLNNFKINFAHYFIWFEIQVL